MDSSRGRGRLVKGEEERRSLHRRIHLSRPESTPPSSVGNMLQTKRGGDDLTENSKRTCTGGETLDSLISDDLHRDGTSKVQIDSFSDSGQSVWSELSAEVTSNLSRNVASLALFDGHTVLFACSGIVVECQMHVTRFVTSASLVRAFNNKRKDHHSLTIQVRREGIVARGILGKYDLDQEIALVNVAFISLDADAVYLNHQVEFLPHHKVVAVGYTISGKLMVTNGILTDDSRGSEDSKGLISSTCKISEDWEGGPLFDYDGNFVGMNLFPVAERTSFLPRSIIIERLEQFLPRNAVKTVSDVEIQRREMQKASMSYYSYPRDTFGYPKPSATMIRDGMILVNTFEETFGDVYDSGEGAWSILSKTVPQNLSRVVVSLASFNGETRLFACTGLFIELNGCISILTSASLVRDPDDGNRIDENLKIKVLLPNKRRKEGILQHYNLYFNVAVVSVKDFRALRSAGTIEEQRGRSTLEDKYVVAVGRCFKSGTLMATHGKRVDWSGALGVRNLWYSTCKISKAGIGGPLVDRKGKFVGMNFYDKKIGTPYLPRFCIALVLADFEGKRIVGLDCKRDPIRWPVPVPCWRHPEDEAKDRRPPGDDEGPAGPFGFGYIGGQRFDYH